VPLHGHKTDQRVSAVPVEVRAFSLLFHPEQLFVLIIVIILTKLCRLTVAWFMAKIVYDPCTLILTSHMYYVRCKQRSYTILRLLRFLLNLNRAPLLVVGTIEESFDTLCEISKWMRLNWCARETKSCTGITTSHKYTANK